MKAAQPGPPSSFTQVLKVSQCMENEVSIRLLYQTPKGIEDGQHDVSLANFGGTVPMVGDRIAIMLVPMPRFVRVVDRIFEAEGGNHSYINLIVEEVDGEDVSDLPRFSNF
ncbi:hypothetical protein [Rhizobium leguminosarum]|uniref:hypothetical protein n=1 Tax=Rhizobium leguminosarum TaxID=384 RepID=UPI003F9A7A38